MICIGIPVHNSSGVLENPLLKINIVLKEIEKEIGEKPYIIFVDDNSSDTETGKMLHIITHMILPEYQCRLLYLKHKDNKGVFGSLNKMIEIITNKSMISSSTKIKSVLFRDHDDYITSANIEAAIKVAKEDVLGVPAIKMDVRESDMEDFKILIKKAETLESLKKRETMFISRYDIESLMFFGKGNSRAYFADNYKTGCVKDIPNYYKEYYDLFHTYALSTYNVRLLEMLGGFDLYSLDSAGTKAYDVCALRILNLIIKNILRKSEEYFITTEKVKEFNDDLLLLEAIEKKTRFSNLLYKPSIFRLVLPGSLSKNNLENREFFYFTKLKQVINNRKAVYYELRNMKNAFMFLKSNEASEIIGYYMKIIKHVIQSLYTPIPESKTQCDIVFQGGEWVLNKEV